jgi:phosphoenolpyruvate carboxykinase (ATP)
MQQGGVNVWLVNTGWSGGSYGHGKRMSLKTTRALITAALTGELSQSEFESHDVFGVAVPKTCPDHKANFLAEAFLKNFNRFSSYANKEILSGAPRTKVHV